MTDWYIAGICEEMFYALVGKQKLQGRTAGEVLRQLVTEAREPDLSWISKADLLDALCRLELAFGIKRRGKRIQWVLNPFRDPPEASGYARTIGEAIDALVHVAQVRHHSAERAGGGFDQR